MTVLVGSRHEGYGEAGMAHLLEHMLFKGTPLYPEPTSIPERHEGARCEVQRIDLVSTGPTITRRWPSTDANLEFAIRLEADRLMNSFIRGADLKSEMTVVRNEFEMGENSPEGILMQRMVATAYEWHNYGKSTIGNRADIERVPIENLHEFYTRYYQPDNAILVVAGKFQPKKVLELVAKYFGPIPRPERHAQLDLHRRAAAGRRARSCGSAASGAWRSLGRPITSRPAATPSFRPSRCSRNILSDDPSGRLYKSLVETKKAATVYGETWSLHDPGVMMLMARVAPGKHPRRSPRRDEADARKRRQERSHQGGGRTDQAADSETARDGLRPTVPALRSS